MTTFCYVHRERKTNLREGEKELKQMRRSEGIGDRRLLGPSEGEKEEKSLGQFPSRAHQLPALHPKIVP